MGKKRQSSKDYSFFENQRMKRIVHGLNNKKILGQIDAQKQQVINTRNLEHSTVSYRKPAFHLEVPVPFDDIKPFTPLSSHRSSFCSKQEFDLESASGTLTARE